MTGTDDPAMPPDHTLPGNYAVAATPDNETISPDAQPGAQFDDAAIAVSGNGRWTHGLAVAVAAVGVGLTSWFTTSPMGLVNDDITNLRLVDSADSVADVVLAPVFYTQVAPGHRLLTALQLAVGPLDRVVMHLLVATMMAASLVIACQVMRHLYGRQLWAPVVMGLAMVSPAVTQTNVWYSSAYHQTPSLLFGLAAVWAWLQHRETSNRRWILLSATLVGCGLAFSVRAGLAVVLMLVLELILLNPTSTADFPGRVWAQRRTWIPYLLPVFIFWEMNRSAGTLSAIGSPGEVLAATARGIVEVLVPLLFGIRVFADRTAATTIPVEMIVLAHAGLILLLVILTRRRRDALHGAAAAMTIAVVGIGLSAYARSGVLGSTVGLVLRYHMEPLVYTVVVLLWGLRGRRDPAANGGVDGVLLARPSRVAAGTVLVGIVATTTWSNTSVVQAFSGDESAQWLEAVDAATMPLGDTPVLDVPIDDAVQPDFPRRRLNDLDWLYDTLHVTMANNRGIDDLAVVTVDGDIEPVVTQELFSQDGGGYATNGLVSAAGTFEIGDTMVCTSSSMQLTVVLAPHETPRWMEVTTTGPAGLHVDIIPTGSKIEISQPDADTVTTATTPIAILPMDLFGDVFGVRLVVSAPASAPACIDHIRFVAVDNDLAATPLG